MHESMKLKWIPCALASLAYAGHGLRMHDATERKQGRSLIKHQYLWQLAGSLRPRDSFAGNQVSDIRRSRKEAAEHHYEHARSSARLMTDQIPSVTAAKPWLVTRRGSGTDLLSPARLHVLADGIGRLRFSDLVSCQAYRPGNSADLFLYEGVPLHWLCTAADGGCEMVAEHLWGERDLTLATAVEFSQAPIAARVVASSGAKAATSALSDWLSQLELATGRPHDTVDAYCTDGKGLSSASAGWHIDDVDVLLIMLRGKKRFRVAGRTLGSHVEIDHVLESGDALFIPALTFHTGGDIQRAGGGFFGSDFFGFGPQPFDDSVMLSVAFPWSDKEVADEARAIACQWGEARDDACIRLQQQQQSQQQRCTWEWAGRAEGISTLAGLLNRSLAQCLLAPPVGN